MSVTQIRYSDLNARQQENYNYHKVSALLADYGFTTILLSDDWQGADFIAHHCDGEIFLKVQLKGRLTFSKKYIGKNLFVAFQNGAKKDNRAWYLYPHDEVLRIALKKKLTVKNKPIGIETTVSWTEHGNYSYPTVPKMLLEVLKPYEIGGSVLYIDEKESPSQRQL